MIRDLHYLKVLPIVILLFASNLFGGGCPSTLTGWAETFELKADPGPPYTVGQTVTFMLESNIFGGNVCDGCQLNEINGTVDESDILVNGLRLNVFTTNGATAQDGKEASPAAANRIPDNKTFTYTFLSPGTYDFTLDCAGQNIGLFTSGPTKQKFSKAKIAGIPLGAFTVGLPIPTMSQWGLIILGIAMLIFGIVAIMDGLIKSSTDSK